MLEIFYQVNDDEFMGEIRGNWKAGNIFSNYYR